jgi:hypothetical protein
VQFVVPLHSDWAELAVELGVKNTPTPVTRAGLAPIARLAASAAAAVAGSTALSATFASPPSWAYALNPTRLENTTTEISNLAKVRIFGS